MGDVPRLTYDQAEGLIQDGDMLLWKTRRGWLQRLIMISGRTRVSHGSMAHWDMKILMHIGTEIRLDAHSANLKNAFSRYPGEIEVHRPELTVGKKRQAIREMLLRTGLPYGKRSLWRAAMTHIPFVRGYVRPSLDDEANGHLPFCTALLSIAYRKAGLDPVRNLADEFTEPGDMSRSSSFEHVLTIVRE